MFSIQNTKVDSVRGTSNGWLSGRGFPGRQRCRGVCPPAFAERDNYRVAVQTESQSGLLAGPGQLNRCSWQHVFRCFFCLCGFLHFSCLAQFLLLLLSPCPWIKASVSASCGHLGSCCRQSAYRCATCWRCTA